MSRHGEGRVSKVLRKGFLRRGSFALNVQSCGLVLQRDDNDPMAVFQAVLRMVDSLYMAQWITNMVSKLARLYERRGCVPTYPRN